MQHFVLSCASLIIMKISEAHTSSDAYTEVKAAINEALEERFKDKDVQEAFDVDQVNKARKYWKTQISEDENLIYVAHQGSSPYHVFVFRYLPLLDIISTTTTFHIIMDSNLWAFHIKDMYPWVAKFSDEIFYNDIIPYAVLDEPRSSTWRYEMSRTVSEEVMEPLDWYNKKFKSDEERIRYIAGAINRDVWSAFKGGPIKKNPSSTALCFQDIISSKEASSTGLSIFLVLALRSVGIPARVAGVNSWNDGEGEICQDRKAVDSDDSVNLRVENASKNLTKGKCNDNKSGNGLMWVEVFDGKDWLFMSPLEYPTTDPPTKPEDSFNKTWFHPSRTNLQILGDPKYAIFASSFSPEFGTTTNVEKGDVLVMPLWWHSNYRGVYAVDVTKHYKL